MDHHSAPDLTKIFSIENIRTTLKNRSPKQVEDSERSHAAVALILVPRASELEVLFIERASHPQDPWSGNLAFPGGRIVPADPTARHAAERETLEEIGLDLRCAEYLGQLDDIAGAYLPVLVSCFVYLLPPNHPPTIELNHEVSSLFGFPLHNLADPGRHRLAAVDWNHKIRETPAIDLNGPGRPLLWGITFRLICQFMTLLGLPQVSAPPPKP